MSPSRIMLTGVPGVGKTTVSQHPLIADMGVTVRNYGQLMFSLGKQKGIISVFKDLEGLTIEQRAELQADAARKIAEDTSAIAIAIDGHLIVDTPSGFVPGLPLDCVSTLNLTSIVLLWAKPKDIVTRRNNNVDKYSMLKRWSDDERIDIHQKVVFQISLQYSLLSQASFDVLDNSQDELDKTVKGFSNFLLPYLST
jgi:adenylate kinase